MRNIFLVVPLLSIESIYFKLSEIIVNILAFFTICKIMMIHKPSEKLILNNVI